MSTPTLTLQEIERLNARFATAHPTEIIRWAVDTFHPQVAATSSFGVRSAVFLHLIVQVDPKIEIRVIDTGLLFPETYQFIDELTRRLKLNVRIFKTTLDVERFKREHAQLPLGHPDFCCSPYKVEAMERSLSGLHCWMTGIRRTDAATRANTPFVELLTNGVVKVAPLAAWNSKALHAYMLEHGLPYHPLWEKGYTSIGCWPCTQRPVDPNDPRSGRWAGQDKTECGIHDIGKPPTDSKKPSS